MKSVFVVLVLLLGLAAVLLSRGGSARSITSHSPRADSEQILPQQTNIIDGSIHPELISDRAAYSVLFRLIANRKTPQEISHIRAYIRQIGFGDADVNGLVAAAEEFHQRVSPLDAQAKQIKAANPGIATPELKGELLRLQHQKDAIVDQLVVTLPQRLTPDARGRLRDHLSERVKRHMKIRIG